MVFGGHIGRRWLLLAPGFTLPARHFGSRYKAVGVPKPAGRRAKSKSRGPRRCRQASCVRGRQSEADPARALRQSQRRDARRDGPAANRRRRMRFFGRFAGCWLGRPIRARRAASHKNATAELARRLAADWPRLAETGPVQAVLLHQPIERAARQLGFAGGGADVALMPLEQLAQILLLERRPVADRGRAK